MNKMSTEIRMPDLGDVEHAVLVAWLVAQGDEVSEGDDLLELETDKATFVVPAPVSGTLTVTRAVPMQTIDRQAVLGLIEHA